MLTTIPEIKKDTLKITDKILQACYHSEKWYFEPDELIPNFSNHSDIIIYYDAISDTLDYDCAPWYGAHWVVPDLDKAVIFNILDIPHAPLPVKELKNGLINSVKEIRKIVNKLPDIPLSEIEKDKKLREQIYYLLIDNALNLKKFDINYSLRFIVLQLFENSDNGHYENYADIEKEAKTIRLILDNNDLSNLNKDTRKWLQTQLNKISFDYEFYLEYGDDVKGIWDSILDTVNELNK